MRNNMFDFYDWGSWGFSSLYKEPKALLMEALESGEEFNTGWHGFKKEPLSLRVEKTENEILVSVGAWMDSVFDSSDLILDCLTDEEEEKLTDEMVAEIRDDLANNPCFCEDMVATKSLPRNTTFEEIIKAAQGLLSECDVILNESFLLCMESTLMNLYDYPDDTTFIEERIEKERRK